MANLIASFYNDNCDVTIWENFGKYEMEIEIEDQEDNKITIELSEYDITSMAKGFAEVSSKLAKEMITEMLEEI